MCHVPPHVLSLRTHVVSCPVLSCPVQPTVRPTSSPSNYRSVTVRVQQQVDGVSLATAQVRPVYRTTVATITTIN